MAGNFILQSFGGHNSLSKSRHSINQYSHITVQGACPLPRREVKMPSAPHRTVPQPDDPFTRTSTPQSINPLPNQHCLRIRHPLRRESAFLCCQTHQGEPHQRSMHSSCMHSPAFRPCHGHTPCSQRATYQSHTNSHKLQSSLIVRKTLTSTVKETRAESLSTGSRTTTQRCVSLLLICLNQTETGIFSLRWPITSTFPPNSEMET